MEFATSLCKIAFKYGTDKCPQIDHPYTPFYYELMEGRRDLVRKVLELGIGTIRNMAKVPHYQTGASLKMWRDFFPNAQVFGADNDPEAMFEDDRITTVLCDERRVSDLVGLINITGKDIDLFVHDAHHAGKRQIATCLTLMPLLDKEVIYIIEDVKLLDEVAMRIKDSGYDCHIVCFNRRKRNLVVVRYRQEI